jgi:indole-3-glycerol phosphate synthase
MSHLAQTGTVLDRIVARTRVDLEQRKSALPAATLQRRFPDIPDPLAVATLLRADTISVVAEFKRASPSKGRFVTDVDPAGVVEEYALGGAAMISCLTDEPFFEGSLADLETVVEATNRADRPVGVLRKDFMIDHYQVDEARAWGASCILLIAACLDDQLLQGLHGYATSLGLSTLMEVHNERELDRVLDAGATLVGINNRDLKTFDVDLSLTERLVRRIPYEVVVVGESGISNRSDVQKMAAAGVDAVLVGESLILQDDRASAVRALTGVTKGRRDQAE